MEATTSETVHSKNAPSDKDSKAESSTKSVHTVEATTSETMHSKDAPSDKDSKAESSTKSVHTIPKKVTDMDVSLNGRFTRLMSTRASIKRKRAAESNPTKPKRPAPQPLMLTYFRNLEMKQLKDGIIDLHASCTEIKSVITTAGRSIKEWERRRFFKGSTEMRAFERPVSVPKLNSLLYKGKMTLDFKGTDTEDVSDSNEDEDEDATQFAQIGYDRLKTGARQTLRFESYAQLTALREELRVN